MGRRWPRSPCCSSVARAASSILAGQPRSRETKAISASARMQRARGHRFIAELRHGDAAQSQSRCILTQGDPVQRAERITRGQRACRCSDQRVHGNPATLVTPTPSITPSLCLAHLQTCTDRSKNDDDASDWNHAKNGCKPGSTCSRRRRISRTAATPWPSCARPCPGFGIDKDYTFDTEGGSATLKDLFQGRSQLLVYHFMFGPGLHSGLPVLLGDRRRVQRHHHPSRQPRRDALGRCRGHRSPSCRVISAGWNGAFPWASSGGSDFNADFNVYFTDAQREAGTIEYNYRKGGHAMDKAKFSEPVKQFAATLRHRRAHLCQRPGRASAPSCWRDGVVYHTYSAYARGVDGIWNMYSWLDRAPKGRNEQGPLVEAARRIREARDADPSDSRHTRGGLDWPRRRADLCGAGALESRQWRGNALRTRAMPLGGMAMMYLLMSAFHLAPLA